MVQVRVSSKVNRDPYPHYIEDDVTVIEFLSSVNFYDPSATVTVEGATLSDEDFTSPLSKFTNHPAHAIYIHVQSYNV